MKEMERKKYEFNIHKKLKKITYTQRKRTPHLKRNSEVIIIVDSNETKIKLILGIARRKKLKSQTEDAKTGMILTH